jgi:hypothetical protein
MQVREKEVTNMNEKKLQLGNKGENGLMLSY